MDSIQTEQNQAKTKLWKDFLSSLKGKDFETLKYFSHKNMFKMQGLHFPSNIREVEALYNEGQKSETQDVKPDDAEWSVHEVSFLIWVSTLFYLRVNKALPFTQAVWDKISEIFPTPRSAKSVLEKWCSLDFKFRFRDTRSWTIEEDDFIKSLMRNKATFKKWTKISVLFNSQFNEVEYRGPKQIRERWNNYLNPKFKKGPWTLEEDLRLLELTKKHNKRWAAISRELDSRSENSSKNRCLSLLSQKRRNIHLKPAMYEEEEVDESENSGLSDDNLLSQLIDELKERLLKEKNKKNGNFLEEYPSKTEVKCANNEEAGTSEAPNKEEETKAMDPSNKNPGAEARASNPGDPSQQPNPMIFVLIPNQGYYPSYPPQYMPYGQYPHPMHYHNPQYPQYMSPPVIPHPYPYAPNYPYGGQEGYTMVPYNDFLANGALQSNPGAYKFSAGLPAHTHHADPPLSHSQELEKQPKVNYFDENPEEKELTKKDEETRNYKIVTRNRKKQSGKSEF